MIKVLQIGMTDNLGGIESYLMNYYRHIDKLKIQFDFINIYDNPLCFELEIKAMGGKIYNVPSYYRHPFKYIKEVVKIIKENKYDVVHCNMNSAAMLFPLIAAKKSGVKNVIAHSHNNSSDKGFIKSFLHNLNKKFIPFFANYYCACSEEAGKWFFSKKIRQSSKYKIIYNGIDIDKFKYDDKIRKKVRKELNINDDEIVYGHVGRFEPQKNHGFLIDVFDSLDIKNKKMILIGTGSLENAIKSKVKKMKLENDVIFLENRNDVNELYQAMDYFILPSLYEGLGMVLVEAQVAGLTVISSDNVPNIAKISDSFYTLSLNKDKLEWAKFISSIKLKRGGDINKSIFDINNCCNELSKFYFDINKIKVCHFVNGLDNGGVEKVIFNYCTNMKNKDDYEFHIITQGKSEENCYKEFSDNNFIIHEVNAKKNGIIKNYLSIKKILKAEQFDICHCHMTVTNFFPVLYSKLSNVKVVISHSHLNEPTINLKNKILILLTRMLSKNRFACGYGAGKYLFGSSSKIYIMSNAINIDKFKYNEQIRFLKRHELHLEDNDVLFGHIGRFVKQKNHDFLIDVFDSLDIKNKKLILIGVGENKNKIERKIKRMNLNDKVIFLNSRNDVNELYQAMDYFLLPSLFEGLPVVGIEAQCAGLKCFVSNYIHQEIKVTENIEFLPLDVKVWKNSIEQNLNYVRKDCSLDISKNNFDIQKEAQKLDEIYKIYLRKK